MVFGLLGHKMATETRRNEYTSLKKNLRQTHTPSLAETQRNHRLDEIQAIDQMSSPPLDFQFQKQSEELSISNKLPIKMDVCVKIVPIPLKTKNDAGPPS